MHADKDQSFYKIALLFIMKVTRHVQSTQNRKLIIFLQYLKKKILLKFVFCIQTSMKVSYKLILTFWVCLARSSQSTHNLSNWLGLVPISLSKFYKIIDYFWETSCTRVRKHFTVATAFAFYCNAKHLYILRGSSHICNIWQPEITDYWKLKYYSS